MLSLDNTYSEKEVADFYARIARLLPSEKIPVVIEPKVDGVAVSLTYEKGKLSYAAARGRSYRRLCEQPSLVPGPTRTSVYGRSSGTTAR